MEQRNINFLTAPLMVLLAGAGSHAQVTPEPLFPLAIVPTDSRSMWIEVANLDQTGRDEVVVMQFGPLGALETFSNTGGGHFELIHSLDTGSTPSDLVLGDYNGDGLQDAVVSSSSAGIVQFFVGGAGPSFTLDQQVTPSAPVGPLVWAQTDNGVELELLGASTTFGQDELIVLSKDANGQFVETRTIPIGSNAYALAAGDFDEDGIDEIAFCQRGTIIMSVLSIRSSGEVIERTFTNSTLR